MLVMSSIALLSCRKSSWRLSSMMVASAVLLRLVDDALHRRDRALDASRNRFDRVIGIDGRAARDWIEAKQRDVDLLASQSRGWQAMELQNPIHRQTARASVCVHERVDAHQLLICAGRELHGFQLVLVVLI